MVPMEAKEKERAGRSERLTQIERERRKIFASIPEGEEEEEFGKQGSTERRVRRGRGE